MIVGAAALLGLAFLVVLGPLIWATVVAFLPALAPMQGTVTVARLGVATVLLATTMFIAHRWLPAARLRFVDIAPGVVASFVSSIVFGEIFGLYLSQFARNYVSTYAGLASVMIALAFLYTLAAIFVFGGALNAAIMRARKAAVSLGPRRRSDLRNDAANGGRRGVANLERRVAAADVLAVWRRR